MTEYNDESSGQVTYTTQYAYNLQGGLTQVTDHLNNITTMSYDLLGRKTGMTDPDMGSWTYQYDAVGNLMAQRDGRAQWLHLGYDNLNRLTSKRLNSTGGPLIAEYIYDTTDKGQLYASKAYDDSGLTLQVETQVLNRDDRYQPTEQQMIVPGQGTFRMAYGYNAAGSQTSIQYPADNSGGLGEIVTNQFNIVGQLNQVISGLDNTHFLDSATYQPSGQTATLRLDQGNNGASTSYSYDTGTLRLQQKQVTNSSGSTTVQDLSYGYDDASNVTTITDTANSGQVQSFGYDWLNRLTSASTTSVGIGQYSHTYAYNAIGNLTNYNGASYTYSSSQPHAVTAAHGNGNQTTRTISGTAHTQTFDAQNRLLEVKQDSTVIGSFVYDSEGNRITGTVSGTTTVYIGGTFEYQAGATTTYYAGPTGPIALRRAGYAINNGIFYMLGDHLGSTSVLINQDGTVAKQEYYYPFGGNRGSAFSDITTKRFTGQYHEADLPGGEGLSYYNARWYDAQLGRFISADTLVPKPENPQSLNRLAYVRNNPLRYTDPTGHAEEIGVCRGCGGVSSNPSYAPPPVKTPSTSWQEWGFMRGQARVNAVVEWRDYFRYKAELLGPDVRIIRAKQGPTYSEMVNSLEHHHELVVRNMGGEQVIKQVIDENPELFMFPVMMTIQGGSGIPKYDRSAYGSWQKGVEREVRIRDNYTCSYCGKRGGDLTIDHVTPLREHWYNQGGHVLTDVQRNSWFNDKSNLVTACRSCNSSKGSTSLLNFLMRIFKR